MATVYIMGWRGTDWRGRWMGRYMTNTHVTLRLKHSSRLSISLHTSKDRCCWLPTRQLERLYTNKFELITERRVGYTQTTQLWEGGNGFDAFETFRWFHGGRLIWPDWRPKGCVNNVREAARFYGYELPDTAYTDDLFKYRITECK
jgi:hypothetical protein